MREDELPHSYVLHFVRRIVFKLCGCAISFGLPQSYVVDMKSKILMERNADHCHLIPRYVSWWNYISYSLKLYYTNCNVAYSFVWV